MLHPHAGTHVEFEDEVEPLLDDAELCLDTGHWLYAGQDPVEAYERWAERIPYVHLKDVDPRLRSATSGPPSAAASSGRSATAASSSPASSTRSADAASTGGRWSSRTAAGGEPVRDLVRSRERIEALT